MLRFAANIGFLFTDLPYLERFEAARDAGFASVEFPWPADDLAEVRRAVAGADLGVALLNMFAGDLSSGERGFPNDPVRVSEWRGWFDQALNLATDLHCPAINVLAGNLIEGISRPQQYACLSKNLRWALGHARSREIALTLEVLNPIETPSYLFTRLDDAATLLNTFADRLFRLQFDTYQLALEGEVSALFGRVSKLVGHIQVADYPGRHEPGTGTIDFARFFESVASSRYTGQIGCEYRPTEAGFGWLSEVQGPPNSKSTSHA